MKRVVAVVSVVLVAGLLGCGHPDPDRPSAAELANAVGGPHLLAALATATGGVERTRGKESAWSVASMTPWEWSYGDHGWFRPTAGGFQLEGRSWNRELKPGVSDPVRTSQTLPAAWGVPTASGPEFPSFWAVLTMDRAEFASFTRLRVEGRIQLTKGEEVWRVECGIGRAGGPSRETVSLSLDLARQEKAKDGSVSWSFLARSSIAYRLGSPARLWIDGTGIILDTPVEVVSMEFSDLATLGQGQSVVGPFALERARLLAKCDPMYAYGRQSVRIDLPGARLAPAPSTEWAGNCPPPQLLQLLWRADEAIAVGRYTDPVIRSAWEWVDALILARGPSARTEASLCYLRLREYLLEGMGH